VVSNTKRRGNDAMRDKLLDVVEKHNGYFVELNLIS